MENINTQEYWETRFSTGDWEDNHGRRQTLNFARSQVRQLSIGPDFKGSIVDFGCGLGDACEIYHASFPHAKLIGIDISETAVAKCRMRYGTIASFFQGGFESIPRADIIIASNVFEHLSNDIDVARNLMSKAGDIYIFVPYKESPLGVEHVRRYDENYYTEIGKYDWRVFNVDGESQKEWDLWFDIYTKNIFRAILGRPIHRRSQQIMFHFSNDLRGRNPQ